MTLHQPRLLVIEDEPEIRQFMRSSLRSEGYRLIEAETVRRGIAEARSQRPDMAIVDLGLPDGDGIDVIHAIRAWSPMPIIVLSARSHEKAKIAALDAGADDYITKPFGIGELFARVRVALRHAVRSRDRTGPIRIGQVVVDPEARTAQREGQDVRLTPIEFRLVTCLVRHLGMVVTHRQLLTEVWGPSHAGDTHYLRIYMKQLREKLEEEPSSPRHLLTETGIGYRLVAGQ